MMPKITVFCSNFYRHFLNYRLAQRTKSMKTLKKYLFEDLANILRQFYGTVLSKTGLINLYNGINRHLYAPPFRTCYYLMNNKIFIQTNLVFSGRLRDPPGPRAKHPALGLVSTNLLTR